MKERKEEEVNIPDIKDIEDIDDDDYEEDDDEDDDEKEEVKISRQVEVTTPYVSVTITTEHKEDDIKSLIKSTERLLDKYKNHHIISSREEDYR